VTNANITLITTGGTIGSSIESDSVNVSRGQKKLRAHIQDLCQRQAITLTIQAAFNKNSEDLAPLDWLNLIQCIEDLVASGVNKIIITHGTDTMAYTAAAVALCCRQHPVKIVLTGSCYSLDHPESDVTENLLGAFATVSESQIPNGVYVSFTNQQGKTDVIDAQNVKPMAFDELGFKACFGQLIGTFKTSTCKFEANSLPRRTQPISASLNCTDIDLKMLSDKQRHIVQLACYPGMDVMQLCSGLKAGSCVIVNLYHSGTGPAQPAECGLLEAVKSFPELTFFLTPLPSPYVTTPYTSTLTLIQAGALLYQDIQPHLLYVFLTLAMACGLEKHDILAHLKSHQMHLPTP